jgi:mRNA interferase HigB
MELIGRAKLTKEVARHGNAISPVKAWIKVVEEQQWNNIVEVRKSLSSADYVNGRTVFNIKGNSFRLIVVIEYDLKTVAYEAFLTHAEYDRYKF